MAQQSSIEWTDETWNPVTGCTKISQGCKHCYAETLTRRLKAMGQAKYANGFALTVHEDSLAEPLRWKQPQLVFVNSMSDPFHEDVPVEFIQQAFDVMRQAHWRGSVRAVSSRLDRSSGSGRYVSPAGG